MKTDPAVFGKIIKDARLSRRLTIRKVEAQSGVSNAYISQLENGMRDIPSPKIIKKLAPSLGLEYEFLLRSAGHL